MNEPFEKQLFESYGDVDYIDMDIFFTNAVLKVDLGPFKAGDKVDMALFSFGNSMATFQKDGEEVTFDIKINLEPRRDEQT